MKIRKSTIGNLDLAQGSSALGSARWWESDSASFSSYASAVQVETKLQPAFADVSALFSSATYRNLASSRPLDALERLARVAPLARASGAESIADVFDAAYSTLLRGYRNEYVFKNAIVSKIVFGRHRPTTASAILELPLGESIADVAVFNGTSTVYEIKTDLDSFGRLASQMRDYTTRIERVNVVVSDRRAATAERHIPERIGLLALRRNGALGVIRPAGSNLAHMRSDHIFGILRTREVEDILAALGRHVNAADPVQHWHQLRTLFSDLSVDDAHEGAVRTLRTRGLGAADIASHPALPKSARALAYSAALSNIAKRRLVNRFLQPLPPAWGH